MGWYMLHLPTFVDFLALLDTKKIIYIKANEEVGFEGCHINIEGVLLLNKYTQKTYSDLRSHVITFPLFFLQKYCYPYPLSPKVSQSISPKISLFCYSYSLPQYHLSSIFSRLSYFYFVI